jgi:hypothetical protein
MSTQQKKRNGAPYSPAIATVREVAYPRLEFIVTILMDTAVILTAVAARWIVLRGVAVLSPAETLPWAVRTLEWIADVGVVSAAAIYTAFDLSKRVVLMGRSFFSLFRKRRHDESTS